MRSEWACRPTRSRRSSTRSLFARIQRKQTLWRHDRMPDAAPFESRSPGRHYKMASSLKAGFHYFSFVFAVGFILGIVRVLFVMPRTGELMAVVFELPVILALAWIICRWLIIRSRVPAEIKSRSVMGMTALVLLLVAEAALSVLVFDNSLIEYLGSFRTAH